MESNCIQTSQLKLFNSDVTTEIFDVNKIPQYMLHQDVIQIDKLLCRLLIYLFTYCGKYFMFTVMILINF